MVAASSHSFQEREAPRLSPLPLNAWWEAHVDHLSRAGDDSIVPLGLSVGFFRFFQGDPTRALPFGIRETSL